MTNAGSTAGRVVVFGSANHDHVLAVADFPRSGETVLAGAYSTGLGGKGANQAVAAARAGASVAFVGAVGTDEHGRDIVANFDDHGIDHRFVARSDEATGLAVVLVDDKGANEIIVAPGANATLSEATVDAAMREVRRGDVIVVQCEIPLPRLEQVVRQGARRDAIVVLNLAPFTELGPEVFPDVGILVVNESEARSLLPGDAVTSDLAQAIAAVAGCACIVTLGESGSSYARPRGRALHVPATLVDAVVDTTGAGDVYVGTLAAALARRCDVATAMGDASRAAAASVAIRGAQPRLPQRTANAIG